MLELDEITAVEIEGSPEQLAEAFRALDECWAAGARDRETTLRLLFLAWYN